MLLWIITWLLGKENPDFTRLGFIENEFRSEAELDWPH